MKQCLYKNRRHDQKESNSANEIRFKKCTKKQHKVKSWRDQKATAKKQFSKNVLCKVDLQDGAELVSRLGRAMYRSEFVDRQKTRQGQWGDTVLIKKLKQIATSIPACHYLITQKTLCRTQLKLFIIQQNS